MANPEERKLYPLTGEVMEEGEEIFMDGLENAVDVVSSLTPEQRQMWVERLDLLEPPDGSESTLSKEQQEQWWNEWETLMGRGDEVSIER